MKLNKFEWFLIIAISILNIIPFILTKSVDMIGITSSITGVICVVMTAKGHISCYFWGFINIVTYILIAYNAKLYGEVILNAAYYLPLQFIGYYMWDKHINKDTKIVKTKGMNIKSIIILFFASVIGTFTYSYILGLMGSNLPLANSMASALSLIAMYLSVKRYKEQWILWIFVNIVSLYMWGISLMNNETNSIVMVIMWFFYLINAVYGYLNWDRMTKNV